ncbi:MAG: bifunctional DNA-formamidopyrimidine glycosylase/DNA-(apurinic or apyrimidinic site) lyase [Hyphomicrobiaceae bacterium]
MPELPEVETVRRGLEPVMAGQVVVEVAQRRPDLRFPFPERFAERIAGCRVLRIGRRAKYLLAELSSGEVLLMHLGMSGRFTVTAPGGAAHRLGEYEHDTGNLDRHDHVVLRLANGAVVTYNDPRRFGFMDLLAPDDVEHHKLLAGLGPEPLGNVFHADHLAQAALGRSVDLKAFLLDQSVVAGLGNIYVAEALHRAGLSPNRSAASLVTKAGRPTARAARLVPAIRAVLEEAIAAGGSTLRDYRHADGTAGAFQQDFRVYGRAGDPCTRPGCRGIVRREVQAGRSTFYCGACQR